MLHIRAVSPQPDPEPIAVDRSRIQLPLELQTREDRFVRLRRGLDPNPPNGDPPPNRVGLAFSGGGIRSATLSLGILQALARKNLLRHIDYLSTVSGGGYIGVFLGGLFSRWKLDEQNDPGKAEQVRQRDWARVEGVLCDPSQHPVSWLRENGRYLAPNGAGDLTLALAIVVRNLLAVHVVLGTLALAVALTLIGIRLSGGALTRLAVDGGVLPELPTVVQQVLRALHPPLFWWSPTVLLAVATFVILVLPLGIAYWLVRSADQPGHAKWKDRPHPLIALGVLGIGGALYALWAWLKQFWALHVMPAGLDWVLKWGDVPGVKSRVLAGTLVIVALESWCAWYFLAEAKVIDRSPPQRPSSEEARAELTQGLRTAMVVTAALFALALIDSLGQTAYSILHNSGASGVGRWIAGGFSSVAGLATLAHRAGGLFAEKTSGRLRLPMQLVTAAVGFTLLLVMLVGVFTVAHSLTWDTDSFREALPATGALQYSLTTNDGKSGEVRAAPDADRLFACTRPVVTDEKQPAELTLCTPKQAKLKVFGAALVLAWLFTYLFRNQYSFVNRSSLAAFYSIRLARAYLGASNQEREKPANQALTTLLPGDELALQQFRPHERGGPLTIINVTVNETVGGRSQVQQRDRKGMGMSIGPAGVSVGVRHHASWQDPPGVEPGHLVPEALVSRKDTNEAQFQVFYVKTDESKDKNNDAKKSIHPYWPSVGRWMAISGAAVSTGLGSRTSVGLSLLIGLLNFRLGYWWRSGIDPMDRPAVMRSGGEMKTRSLFGAIARRIPVQMHLIDEWFARFPGTSSADWYLSDGGHFENSGAYELIRRRLPYIIVCDNGADPERAFDDLGNLVRKARIDFGAHINFLQKADFAADDERLYEVAGTLSDIGFCGQLGEALEEGAQGTNRTVACKAAEKGPRLPKRYAALARITYEDDYDSANSHWLLWLRPAVLGIEPFDVLNYQVANPAFPQQSTGDQFFDEAQWESYRRLGEFMACHVFSAFHQKGDTEGGWKPWTPLEKRGNGDNCGSAALGRSV